MLPTLRMAAAAMAASTSLTGLVAPMGSAPAPTGTVADVRTATQVAASMTLQQRVGQLFMVGTPATGASGAALSSIRRYHVGNVMLTGRSFAGVAATARVSGALQARVGPRSTARVRLFVATDQEGGFVQVLHGPGFSEIPTGLAQGRLPVATLRARAGAWARQLHRAGVNVDLAPVADTVPSPQAALHNAPIGFYQREYGFTTRRVARHVAAFTRGMAAGGVAATAKHFPGLGRVRRNTDTASGVTDHVTVRHDAYLRPFQRAVRVGAPFVMMSTADYARLDPGTPAAFSSFIIRTMLRGDLGFSGVVISDSLNAAQVQAWRPGQRAVSFIRAGGDIALVTDPSVLPAMYDAVLRRARTHRTFRLRVNRAALDVLMAKQHHHLLAR